ncbi:MAG: LmeA family phospholipid-binding protein [Acidimicrobiia bacterium]
MRKVKMLVLAALIVACLAAGDVAARSWAVDELRDYAAAYYPPGTAAFASIDSFPFVGRLLVAGRVPEVSVSMEGLRYDPLVVRRLRLDLFDVDVDRAELTSGRVRLLDVGRGHVEALVDGASIARATGADLRFSNGRVEIHRQVEGVDVSATFEPRITGDTLVLRPTAVDTAGVPLDSFAITYPIPGAALLPCDAGAYPTEEGLVFECEIDDVPAALVQAASALVDGTVHFGR